jgi:hypothetical protein
LFNSMRGKASSLFTLAESSMICVNKRRETKPIVVLKIRYILRSRFI